MSDFLDLLNTQPLTAQVVIDLAAAAAGLIGLLALIVLAHEALYHGRSVWATLAVYQRQVQSLAFSIRGTRSTDGDVRRGEFGAVVGDSVDSSAGTVPRQQAGVHARQTIRAAGVPLALTDERRAGSEPAESLHYYDVRRARALAAIAGGMERK